jgi:VWFA-related protein
MAMSLKRNGFRSLAIWTSLIVGLSAQAPTTPQSSGAAQRPTFRASVAIVTQDVTVKDERGVFIDDLRQDEFEVYEDGVKQKIVSMTMVHGGRVSNLLVAAPSRPPEGIILPPVKKAADTSGRIFMVFIDDLNIQFKNSPQVRQIMEKMAKNLLHDGDLFGVVSSGPSSIAIDSTYDIKRLKQAADKVHGDGLKPNDIIEQSLTGGEAPTELRYRAHVAFETMFEGLANLEKIHDKRKALIWISEGYDYNPYQAARYGLLGPTSGNTQALGALLDNLSASGLGSENTGEMNPNKLHDALKPSSFNREMMRQETFSDADLFRDLAELTRAANRANTTIYSVDPRGLVAGPDIDENIDQKEWGEYVRKSQDTLRMLADETGGIPIVNINDYDKWLKKIDADSSDYYMLGYYSNNPDPTRRRRKIEIKVTRKGAASMFRKEYLMKIEQVPASNRP